MIDWARVAELRDEVGEDDFDEVVDLFMQEVEETLAPYRKNSACDDPSTILHSMKGSAWNLGFTAMSGLCEELENDDLPDTMNMDPIIKSFDQSAKAFFAELSNQSWAA